MFLTTYIAEGNRQKSEKNLMFLVQAGTFLCFQAGRSSATRSSASDLTVSLLNNFCSGFDWAWILHQNNVLGPRFNNADNVQNLDRPYPIGKLFSKKLRHRDSAATLKFGKNEMLISL